MYQIPWQKVLSNPYNFPPVEDVVKQIAKSTNNQITEKTIQSRRCQIMEVNSK